MTIKKNPCFDLFLIFQIPSHPLPPQKKISNLFQNENINKKLQRNSNDKEELKNVTYKKTVAPNKKKYKIVYWNLIVIISVKHAMCSVPILVFPHWILVWCDV